MLLLALLILLRQTRPDGRGIDGIPRLRRPGPRRRRPWGREQQRRLVRGRLPGRRRRRRLRRRRRVEPWRRCELVWSALGRRGVLLLRLRWCLALGEQEARLRWRLEVALERMHDGYGLPPDSTHRGRCHGRTELCCHLASVKRRQSRKQWRPAILGDSTPSSTRDTLLHQPRFRASRDDHGQVSPSPREAFRANS